MQGPSHPAFSIQKHLPDANDHFHDCGATKEEIVHVSSSPQESSTALTDLVVNLLKFFGRRCECHPTVGSPADCQHSCCFNFCLVICWQKFYPGADCFGCLKSGCLLFVHVARLFSFGARAKDTCSGDNGFCHVCKIWMLLQQFEVLLRVKGDLCFVCAFLKATYAAEVMPC